MAAGKRVGEMMEKVVVAAAAAAAAAWQTWITSIMFIQQTVGATGEWPLGGLCFSRLPDPLPAPHPQPPTPPWTWAGRFLEKAVPDLPALSPWGENISESRQRLQTSYPSPSPTLNPGN